MRNYKKKTDRGTIPKETYAEAANEVLSGFSSLRKAAQKYNINFMTLQRFCKRMESTKGGRQLIFHCQRRQLWRCRLLVLYNVQIHQYI